jgi:hypothetical protein
LTDRERELGSQWILVANLERQLTEADRARETAVRELTSSEEEARHMAVERARWLRDVATIIATRTPWWWRTMPCFDA